jgi:hypothetical protein
MLADSNRVKSLTTLTRFDVLFTLYDRVRPEVFYVAGSLGFEPIQRDFTYENPENQNILPSWHSERPWDWPQRPPGCLHPSVLPKS